MTKLDFNAFKPINEEEQPTRVDPKAAEELKKIEQLPYDEFMNKIKNEQGEVDPKILQAIKAGLKDGKPEDEKVSFQMLTPSVSEMVPTQNEIDVEKSLLDPKHGPLTHAADAEAFLNDEVKKPGGYVVTCSNGKYIIDGHHRWSAVLCCNRDAKISAMDVGIKDPEVALKATQLSIAVATDGEIPTQKVDRANLFDITEEELKQLVLKNVTDDVVEVFKKHGKANTKEEVAEYVWGNVKILKRQGEAAPDWAPKRDIMPQAGDVPGWDKALKSGVVNFKEPFEQQTEALKKYDSEMKEWRD